MAKRYNLTQNDACREKIRTTQLINRLQDHVFKDLELSATQLRAIEIMLKKVLPDLSAQELTGDVTQYVARLPQPAQTAAQWVDMVSQAQGSPETGEGATPVPDSPKVH